MLSWLPYVPTILAALIELARLLFDMANKKNGADIKACSVEIESARKVGDTAKLNLLIDKMSKGKPCE